jgi:hypothetical protein
MKEFLNKIHVDNLDFDLFEQIKFNFKHLKDEKDKLFQENYRVKTKINFI